MTPFLRLLDAGLHDDLSPSLAKRVKLANYLALTIVLVTAPFAPIFALSGYPILGAFVAPVALGYLVAPLLNRRRHYLLARISMLTTGCVAPFVFGLLVGRESDIDLYLLAVMCLPLVIFEPRDKVAIVAFTALPALLFILMDVTDFFGVKPLPMTALSLYVVRLAMIVATITSIVAALGFLFVTNVRTERGLAEGVARLEGEIRVRRESEEQLRHEKDRFQSIFGSVQDLVFLIDRDNRYVAMNPRMDRYGLKPEDIVGRTIREIMSPGEADFYERIHAQVFRTGVGIEFERSHPDGRGAAFVFHIVLSPVRDAQGEVTGLVGVSRDVTQERRMQDALREARDAADAASMAKTYFLANVSHELRTPLAVIGGYADMLHSRPLADEPSRRAVEMIRRNCVHLNALVGDILDVSLIETGRLRIRRARVSLAQELEAPLAALAAEARQKGLDFTQTTAPDLPDGVHVDPVRLRQIVTNVVGNAVKFTGAGSVAVALRPQRAAARPGIAIEVRDTGCGISPEKAGQLFQPFTQGDASTTRKYGGTGLGLALARSLARALGGDVRLERSAPDRGSTFVVTVAIDADEERSDGAGAAGGPAAADPPPEAAPTAAGPPGLSGARLLVVDDTADIRLMLEETLKLYGAQVDAAVDGPEGLRLAAAGAYDVILMDIQLPGMDGYEVTRRLRAAGVRIPIIALTGRASPGELEACLAAGCDDYLAKPVSLATLVAKTAAQRGKARSSDG